MLRYETWFFAASSSPSRLLLLLLEILALENRDGLALLHLLAVTDADRLNDPGDRSVKSSTFLGDQRASPPRSSAGAGRTSARGSRR